MSATKQIEKMIDDLELCHHKAARRVDLIIEAIAKGETTKGPGARPCGQKHPAEIMWQNAIDILSAWCSDEMSSVSSPDVDGISANEVSGLLGKKTDLKEWQVRQIILKLKAASGLYPDVKYQEIVEYPEHYQDVKEFRERTVQMVVHDSKDGEDADISLASIIDHLEPCNWNFKKNLVLALRVINGDLHPEQPFAAHARNVRINPIRDRMLIVQNTLRSFCGDAGDEAEIDETIFGALGGKTDVKKSLARKLMLKLEDIV